MIVINRKPSRRQLRQFSGVALLFFGALAAWFGSRGAHPAVVGAFGVLALVLGVAGLLSTYWARIAYLACVYVTYPIGMAISWINLVVLYYLILTPIALVLRLLRRDALALRHDPQRASYWRERKQPAPARYFEQS